MYLCFLILCEEVYIVIVRVVYIVLYYIGRIVRNVIGCVVIICGVWSRSVVYEVVNIIIIVVLDVMKV